MHIPSSGGIELAVFELAGQLAGTPLLISHATGFHGRCYQPMADALADVAHSFAFDYRGHGDTPASVRAASVPIDWQRYGDDATAMATWLAEQAGEPIVAFGHSMGGACLLIAAHRDPSLFRRIVVFEPIVFPPSDVVLGEFESPMVAGARRRRTSFSSFEEAIANFASKPPLNAFDADALDAYVRHGFALNEDGTVQLKCLPTTEADTFAAGGLHNTWACLPEISTNVLVISGRLEEMSPSMIAGQIAERLPNGRFLQRDDLDHFGPMTHPGECAAIVRREL